MDIQSLSHQQQQQQQKDFFATLFPPEDMQAGDNNARNGNGNMQGHGRHGQQGLGSRGNPSPASSSSSSGPDAPHSGPNAINTSNMGNLSNSNNPMYSPSSPVHPQSPNSQLTMQLLGNLMQMQALDQSFSMASPAMSPNAGMGGLGFGGMGFGSPPSISNLPGGIHPSGHSSSSQNGGSNASFGGSGSGANSNNSNNNNLLEQQIKFQQLQQLQQLQTQIFQQQMALITGQSPPLAPGSPLTEMHQQSFQQQSNQNHSQPSFTGLPTPGPSTELRPQQPQSMEFVSPMILNNYSVEMESDPSGKMHSQSHPSPHLQQSSHPYPLHDDSNNNTFSQQMQSNMTSNHGPSLSFAHHHHSASHSFDPRTTNSAPEHIAFDIRSGPTPSPHFAAGPSPHELDLDISPLTSPWLGAYGDARSTGMGDMSGGGGGGVGDRLVRSGGRERRGSSTTTNKRTASSSGDESSMRPSRKKHSPAVGPTLDAAGAARRLSSYKGSKSTNSTPLLRGTRSRSKSGAGPMLNSNSMMTPINPGGNGNGNVNGGGGGGMAVDHTHLTIPGGASGNNNQQLFSSGGVPGDSPSPVDLSMPPPPAPAAGPVQSVVDPVMNRMHGNNNPPTDANSNSNSMMGGGGGCSPMVNPVVPSMMMNMNAGPSRLTPVTPASIMNLGRLGINTSTNGNGTAGTLSPTLNGSTATTRGSKGKTKSDAGSKGTKGGSSQPSRSPGLKAILPAGGTLGSAPSQPLVESGYPPLQKKTSHKAAEQKRRDSLKTTFDDLRKLLPPIAFEDSIDEAGEGTGTGNGAGPRAGCGSGSSGKEKDKVLPVRGPLLPGALPPRGPPKAGGEGPNKAVSKLQLLICGNQYIRTLKGRVERRDEEIARLRREVGRLRGRVAGGGGGARLLEREGEGDRMQLDGVGEEERGGGGGVVVDEEEEEIDLERDLDAVEGMGVYTGLVAGAVGDYEDDGDE